MLSLPFSLLIKTASYKSLPSASCSERNASSTSSMSALYLLNTSWLIRGCSSPLGVAIRL